MTPAQLNAFVKSAAERAGFDRCGVAAACPIGRGGYLRWWLAKGMAGSMDYMHHHLEKRLDPRELLPDARSAIVVALSYNQPKQSRDREAEGDQGGSPKNSIPGNFDQTPLSLPARGRVAMYAWGEDYHDVLRDKLRDLERLLRAEIHEPFDCKICVDTAPIVERELAAAAGVGWIAKNTMVIDPDLGSYLFLGVMLTTLDIAADEPIADHCGSCTACLEACPTQAFFAPYKMDASCCISYLTIEHRGDISRPFQEMMGDWVFGCDVCQDVCPHNRKSPDAREPRFAARDPAPAPPLDELLSWTNDDYRENLRGSAMTRAKLDMLQRNARIVELNLRRNTQGACQPDLPTDANALRGRVQ